MKDFRFKRFKRKIILISLIVIAIIFYVGICASKTLVAIGKNRYEAEMSTSCYQAINKVVNDDTFSDLFNIVSDANGNIVMISANGLKLNYLTKTLAEECLKSYNILASGGVDVPMGAFTGITFLSGLGQTVNLKLITINSVKCQFKTVYEDAGINQTRQSIYLKIVPDCKIVAGLKSYEIQNEIEILCFENYLIGKVPETFVDLSMYTAQTK